MYFPFAGFTLQLSVNSLFPEALSLKENLPTQLPGQGAAEEGLMGLGKIKLLTANLKTKHITMQNLVLKGS